MVVTKGFVDNNKRSIANAEGLHVGQPTVPITVPVCVTERGQYLSPDSV